MQSVKTSQAQVN